MQVLTVLAKQNWRLPLPDFLFFYTKNDFIYEHLASFESGYFYSDMEPSKWIKYNKVW